MDEPVCRMLKKPASVVLANPVQALNVLGARGFTGSSKEKPSVVAAFEI